jgi:hypothetical protein
MSFRVSRYIFAIAVLASLVVGPSAKAEVPGLTTYDRAESVVSKIFADFSDCSNPSGLSQVFYKSSENSFFLYWKGSVDSRVQDYVSALPMDVKVLVSSAPYSWCELEATANAVVEEGTLLGVSVAYPAENGGSVIVETQSANSASQISEVQQKLNDLPGTFSAVTVEGSSEVVAASSRQSDSSPWSGGAGYFWPIGTLAARCSTSAGVWSDANDVPYLLTASHCVEPAIGKVFTTYTGDGTAAIGKVDMTNTGYYKPDNDVAVIKPNSNTVSDQMFHGDIFAASTLTVWGAGTSSLYQSVCINGANTGKHCNAQVTGVGMVVRYNNYDRKNMVRAESTDSTYIVGTGDSGGPVFNFVSSTNHYMLDGIIGGLDPSSVIPCGVTFVPSECAKTAYYENAASGLTAIHMHLSH